MSLYQTYDEILYTYFYFYFLSISSLFAETFEVEMLNKHEGAN